ncbi:hypothetical protein FRAHR75_1500009 [Frankia sp. Hr75.2]|nr:hypothetical protein FRAHR75_1500009 [Frankia sp. Hr75.2]
MAGRRRRGAVSPGGLGWGFVRATHPSALPGAAAFSVRAHRGEAIRGGWVDAGVVGGIGL